MTAAQISALAGFSPINPSAQPNRWKRQGAIFAIQNNGLDYFPHYGLDPDRGYRPLKALAPILARLAGVRRDWGLALWFASVNSYLGGQRPQDVLKTAPDEVLAEAEAEAEAAGVLPG
ncbi:hypothetical protein [Elstera sp.]|uniref:hypothetical protein n=1 Tax=Elstera sp. TaxID=1916664 RepID=UPI0037BF269E